MPSSCKLIVLLVSMVTLSLALETLGQPVEKERLFNDLERVEDDGSVETALMNYLFAKQVFNKLQNQLSVSDLQRKRSYWKQCAFNAVSCFGK